MSPVLVGLVSWPSEEGGSRIGKRDSIWSAWLPPLALKPTNLLAHSLNYLLHHPLKLLQSSLGELLVHTRAVLGSQQAWCRAMSLPWYKGGGQKAHGFFCTAAPHHSQLPLHLPPPTAPSSSSGAHNSCQLFLLASPMCLALPEHEFLHQKP